MGRPKQFTVKHFLNKKLPPQINGSGQKSYPIYLRMRYAGKLVETKSLLTSISRHIELKPVFTKFYEEVEMWQYDYFTEGEYENISEVRKNILQKEIEWVHEIFIFYQNSNINILENNTRHILGIHLRPLFLVLEDYLKILLNQELQKDLVYKHIAPYLLNTNTSFSILFNVLSRISNDKLISTHFYETILKPLRPHYMSMMTVYSLFTIENFTTVINYPKQESLIREYFTKGFEEGHEKEVSDSMNLIEQSVQFYLRQIGVLSYTL